MDWIKLLSVQVDKCQHRCCKKINDRKLNSNKLCVEFGKMKNLSFNIWIAFIWRLPVLVFRNIIRRYMVLRRWIFKLSRGCCFHGHKCCKPTLQNKTNIGHLKIQYLQTFCLFEEVKILEHLLTTQLIIQKNF